MREFTEVQSQVDIYNVSSHICEFTWFSALTQSCLGFCSSFLIISDLCEIREVVFSCGLHSCVWPTWGCRSWNGPRRPAALSCPGSALLGSRSCCTRWTGTGSGRWKVVPPAGAAAAAARSAGRCPGIATARMVPTEPWLPGGVWRDQLEDLVPLQRPGRSPTCWVVDRHADQQRLRPVWTDSGSGLTWSCHKQTWRMINKE